MGGIVVERAQGVVERAQASLAGGPERVARVGIVERRREAGQVPGAVEHAGERAQPAGPTVRRPDNEHAEHLAAAGRGELGLEPRLIAEPRDQRVGGALGERVRRRGVERAGELAGQIARRRIEPGDVVHSYFLRLVIRTASIARSVAATISIVNAPIVIVSPLSGIRRSFSIRYPATVS